MIAIILAAGFSTRLYPLTKDVPKGLLQMGKKQIASYAVDNLVHNPDISKIYLVTSSCFSKQYREWINANYKGRISFIENGVTCMDEKLGAIGDLLYAVGKEKINEDLLVVPSDTLVSLDIRDLISFFKMYNGITTAVYETDDKDKIANRLGCAVLDGVRITKFVEKPANPPSLFMGVPYYLFPKHTLHLIEDYRKDGGSLDSPGSIISWLIGKTPVYAFRVNGFYYDVGTVNVYNQLKDQILRLPVNRAE